MVWRRLLNQILNNEKIIDDLSKTKFMQESARAAHQVLNKAKQMQSKQSDIFVDFTKQSAKPAATPKPTVSMDENYQSRKQGGWIQGIIDDARADLIDLERKFDSFGKKR